MAAEVLRRPQDHGLNGGRDLYPSQDNDHENNGLPSDDIEVDDEAIKEIPRYFIMQGLCKNGFVGIANRLQRVRNPDHNMHKVIEAIASEFERERSKQFEDIFSGLYVNRQNLKITYDTVLTELFREGIHWGKIIGFLVFARHIAVYCAQHKMENRVEDVVHWSELEMQTRIHDWVKQRGGWSGFAQHFDEEPEVDKWYVGLSSAILGTGFLLTMVVGGLLVIKNLLR